MLKREIKELKSPMENSRMNSNEVEGMKKYIVALNEAMDIERRKIMKL
jgi:hypothetical protein